MKPVMAKTGWKEAVIQPLMPISAALSTLNRSEGNLLLLCEEDNQLVGTLTYDDIREAVLAGVSLGEPCLNIANHNPITVSAPVSRMEVMSLLNGKSKPGPNYLPLVDEVGRVIDVLTYDHWLDGKQIPLAAVIMAGGFGTRLRPLTDSIPKPLLPVGEVPMMALMIERLRQAGIQRFYITTHYLAEKIMVHFGDGAAFGVEVTYVAEHTPLGTAGALGLIENPEQPVLVLNGDILTSLDFRALWTFHCTHQSALTVAVRQYEYQVPYGVVDAEGAYLRQISEKPSLNFLVNAGVYLLDTAVWSYIPTGQRFDMPDLIQALLADGLPVINFPVVEYWLDIGRHADYQQAQEDFQHGHFKL